MQDGIDGAVEMAGLKHVEEVVLVEILIDLAIDEILELLGALEIVDGDDVGHAALVEGLDDVGTDKPGRAGDDGVHSKFLRF